MNEQVLVVHRDFLPSHWKKDKIALSSSEAEVNSVLKNYRWMKRNDAEQDEDFKQIIPYLILFSSGDNKFAIYRRGGNEKRLHGLYSIGVGGHINPVDRKKGDTPFDTIIRSAYRELNEELYITGNSPVLRFKGMINEEVTKVGRVHTGLVFKAEMYHKPDAAEELFDLHWVKKKDILNNYRLELWSEMALKLID